MMGQAPEVQLNFGVHLLLMCLNIVNGFLGPNCLTVQLVAPVE